MNQIFDPVSTARGTIKHPLDLLPVRKPHTCPGRIERQLMQQISRKASWIGGKEGFQLPDITKLFAIEQFPGGGDGL